MKLKNMKEVYNKTNWVDGKTPVNAQNLRKIEQALYDLFLKSVDRGSIVGRDHIVVETDEDSNIVIRQKELIKSKTIDTIEYVTELPEEVSDEVLYVVLEASGQITKVYKGHNLVLERLIRLPENEALVSDKILNDGEICVISRDGRYDSLVIGDGISKISELTIIPLNVDKGSVLFGEATPSETLNDRGFYITRTQGTYEGVEIENGELAVLHYKEGKWNKISLGKFSSIGHTHVVADITDFPDSMPASDVYPWAKEEHKPVYKDSEIVGLQGKLDEKVDKVPGQSLMTDEEREKLKNLPTGSEINDHVTNKENPHQVTKAQVGLGDVDNTADISKPISGPQQKGLDKKVDKTTTINGHSLENSVNLVKGDIGLGNVDNTADLDKPISTATQEALERKVDKTITVNTHPLSGNVVVTKGDIGLGNVDNTSDLNKPISKATQAELEKKVDKTITICKHPLSANVVLAKDDITGLDKVDNTADLDKPISTATQEALERKVDKTITVNTHPLDNNITLTKEDIGLENVENTSDLEKPVSTATQAELDKKVNKTTTVNGHSLSGNVTITKGDIDLGSVDNTSDLEKPVSTLQQKALDTKVDKREGYSLVKDTELTDLKNHMGNTGNPHGVTKAQVGLENVDNTADSQKPVSVLQQKELDKKVDKTITVNSHPLSGNVVVTKGDIGLGKVENTSDLEKPVSTATQGELNKKVDKTVTVNSHPLSANVTITKADIGLGNVDNTSDINKPISTATQAALDKKVDKTITVNSHALSGNVVITKGDIGLGSVDNTADTSKPISTLQQAALDKKVDKRDGYGLVAEVDLTNLKSHIGDTENPHGVTKAQVGLGKVDNTSDLEKPMSTETKTRINEVERVTSNGLMETVRTLKETNSILAEALNKMASRLDRIEEKLKTL